MASTWGSPVPLRDDWGFYIVPSCVFSAGRCLPVPSIIRQPAAWLELEDTFHSWPNLSVDNPAPAGDNIHNTCPIVPEYDSPEVGCKLERIGEVPSDMPEKAISGFATL